ncbi:salicylate hydroxylase [Fusarium mundagurra]|uniref:Salicylate hydroxylase n=1 Tax=Fusarium mundagurra TaxID=1567541 RepID=A0A8H6DE36_9HYPO|nr:salicylate hydroxylase [Fusarium mundagurra]
MVHIIIIGAGPAGLAAALALSQTNIQGSPLRITILELRPKLETLGGTILLTPLALRYLDALGVGSRLRKLGIPVRGVDVVALRTGRTLGQMFPGIDALRVMRHHLVQCMADVVAALPKDRIDLRYGARVTGIQQDRDDEGNVHVNVQFDTERSQESISGDILLGCDGIHSFVRTTVVDRERKKTYSGRAVAYGYVDSDSTGQIGVTTLDEKPILRDSTLIQGQHGSFLMTHFEPSRQKVYALAIMPMAENQDARDGWKASGEDKVTLKRDIVARFREGSIRGLESMINESDWYFYPVYMLLPEGRWSKGRVLLLGDAAHAMPPQGESTGIAIEDGILFAHVLGEGISKGVPYVMEAYEALRRNDIKKLHAETMFRWNAGTPQPPKAIINSNYGPALTNEELYAVARSLSELDRYLLSSCQHVYKQIVSGELNADESQQRLASNDLEDIQTIMTQIEDITLGRFVFSDLYLKERHILYYWGRGLSIISRLLLMGDDINPINQPALGMLKTVTEYASDIESAVLNAGSAGVLTSDYRLVLSERWDLLENAIKLYHQHSQTPRTVSKWPDIARKIQGVKKVPSQDTRAGLATHSGTFTAILWLTFVGTTLSNVWTFALAYSYSDHKPGTTKDADFWFLMQSCITQGFTLIISGIPLRADPRLPKRTWVPPMLLALICTIIAPPLYLTAPTEWSSFVGLIASGLKVAGPEYGMLTIMPGKVDLFGYEVAER